jgi:hypothetical protein
MTIILAQATYPGGVEQVSDPLRVQGNPAGLFFVVTASMAQADLDDTTLRMVITIQPSFDPQGNVWQGAPWGGCDWGGGLVRGTIQQTSPVQLGQWGMDTPVPRWLRVHVTPSRDLVLSLDGTITEI